MNKVVARFADGRVVKGMTLDFSPEKDMFHVARLTLPLGATSTAVRTGDLKALFFVRNYAGDPLHVEENCFESASVPEGRRMEAVFKDGEILVGTTPGFRADLPGFYLVPADTGSNIRRAFVVTAATEDVAFL